MPQSAFEINVTGLTGVEKVFLNLPKTTAKRAYKKALKAGGTVIRNLASAKVKAIVSNQATGTLARGLAVYSLKNKDGNYRAGVMVRKKLLNTKKIVNGQPVRVGLYASVLEYGKAGQPAKSWLRSAAREGTSAAFEAINDEMAKQMDLAVADAKQ